MSQSEWQLGEGGHVYRDDIKRSSCSFTDPLIISVLNTNRPRTNHSTDILYSITALTQAES